MNNSVIKTGVLLLALTLLSCESTGTSSKAKKVSKVPVSKITDRYKALWHSVNPNNNDFNKLLVQLGATANNRSALWVLLTNEARQITESRQWELVCNNNIYSRPSEAVYDAEFGVVLLDVDRKNLPESANCILTLNQTSQTSDLTLKPLPSENRKPYSFLAYSCNEPFTSAFRNDKTGILNRDLSLWDRMSKRASGEIAYKEVNKQLMQLPESPDYVLGLGDQIYVDPDPKIDEDKFDLAKKLAFFGGERSNEWFFEPTKENFIEALSTVYRFNFALPPTNNSFSKLPSMMMWDDHEIRDGWGSQGDENVSPWPEYYSVARKAFIANQYLRSVAPQKISQEKYNYLVEDETLQLHTSFSRDTNSHTLMLDGRSTRGKTSLFDEPTMEHVKAWLSKGTKNTGDLFVLTTGTPLTPNKKFASIIGAVSSEVEDDLQDAWASQENSRQRVELFKVLENYFSDHPEDRLLVLSGDVHFSAIFSLSLTENNNNELVDTTERVYGHEVITSGIAHALPSGVIIGNAFADYSVKLSQTNIRPLGKISHSATFAEILVEPSIKSAPPAVSVIFHANGTKQKSVSWLPNYAWIQDLAGLLTNTPTWVLGNTGFPDATSTKPYY
jgi:hypothetical protein